MEDLSVRKKVLQMCGRNLCVGICFKAFPTMWLPLSTGGQYFNHISQAYKPPSTNSSGSFFMDFGYEFGQIAFDRCVANHNP